MTAGVVTDPDALGFVLGVDNGEDLVRIPGTPWIVVSGFAGPERPQGHLYVVHSETKALHEVFPAGARIAPRAPYDGVDAPDPRRFSAHGIALRATGDGRCVLYVVGHGEREAIHVFEVDASGALPTCTWIGAIPQADGVTGNSVAALPGEGIVATNFMPAGDPEAVDRACRGEATGNVMEWQPESGWSVLPESEICGPNGINVTADGSVVFVASWPTGTLVRLSRGDGPVRRDVVELGFLPDNLKWTDGGERLLLTGQDAEPTEVFAEIVRRASCAFPVVTVSIDPATLGIDDVVRLTHPVFGMADGAIEVDGTLWISSSRNDRIAYVPAPAGVRG